MLIEQRDLLAAKIEEMQTVLKRLESKIDGCDITIGKREKQLKSAARSPSAH